MAVALSMLTSGPFDGSDVTPTGILRIYFKITPSGNYTALGDTMDFTTLAGSAPLVSSYPPIFVVIQSAASGGASGYLYEYCPGATPTQANGKFQVLKFPAVSGPGVDLGAGAYPAAITSDVIIGHADFVRL